MPLARIGVLKVMKVMVVVVVTAVVVQERVIEVKDLLTVIVHRDHHILIVLRTVVKVIGVEGVQEVGKVIGVQEAGKAEEVQGAGRVAEVRGAGRVTELEGVGKVRGIVLIHHPIDLPVVAVVVIRITETRQGGAIVLMMRITTTLQCLHRLLNFLG